jgi:hypothetical protein
MKINITLSNIQKEVLNDKFLRKKEPYGYEIWTIDFGLYELTDEIINARNKLLNMGILVLFMDRYYRLTEIGEQLYNFINNEKLFKNNNITVYEN